MIAFFSTILGSIIEKSCTANDQNEMFTNKQVKLCCCFEHCSGFFLGSNINCISMKISNFVSLFLNWVQDRIYIENRITSKSFLNEESMRYLSVVNDTEIHKQLEGEWSKFDVAQLVEGTPSGK